MKVFLEEFQHLRVQLEDIMSATGNFDNRNIIGKGGFGIVYEGVLSHFKGRSMVAFKRLDRSYGQGDPEFWKEILMLSRYTNEHLISLLGFCDQDGEKIIVYEYASHGSLDCQLSNTTLTWKQRLKICLATAKGLSYLHDPKETQQRVIHRDIKSSNILLDDNWNAKVSDMGLSKIGPANQPHTFLVSNVVGTLGYIDPMYMQTGILTKESDVYSFGIVLFEVLCGRLCYESTNGFIRTLEKTWKKSYKRKKLDEIIIQDMEQNMDQRSLKTFSDIAFQCLKKSPEKRPNMSHVVKKLEIALRFQDIFEVAGPSMDYEEMSNTVVPPLFDGSTERMFVSEFIKVLGFCLKWFGDICTWEDPWNTTSAHLILILFVWTPYISMLALFLLPLIDYIFNFIADSYRPDMNTKISKTERVQKTYDHLRTVIKRIHAELGDMWAQDEQLQSLMSWRDPRATAIFLTLCLVALIVVYVIPFRVIAFLVGIYKMRHPRLGFAIAY